MDTSTCDIFPNTRKQQWNAAHHQIKLLSPKRQPGEDQDMSKLSSRTRWSDKNLTKSRKSPCDLELPDPSLCMFGWRRLKRCESVNHKQQHELKCPFGEKTKCPRFRQSCAWWTGFPNLGVLFDLHSLFKRGLSLLALWHKKDTSSKSVWFVLGKTSSEEKSKKELRSTMIETNVSTWNKSWRTRTLWSCNMETPPPQKKKRISETQCDRRHAEFVLNTRTDLRVAQEISPKPIVMLQLNADENKSLEWRDNMTATRHKPLSSTKSNFHRNCGCLEHSKA